MCSAHHWQETQEIYSLHIAEVQGLILVAVSTLRYLLLPQSGRRLPSNSCLISARYQAKGAMAHATIK